MIFRRETNRAPNRLVSSAPANVSAHSLVDIGVGRISGFVQECGRRHDLARLAVTALRHVLFYPRPLHGMAGVRRKAFDGRDVLPGHARNRGDARPNRLTVEMDGAGTA